MIDLKVKSNSVVLREYQVEPIRRGIEFFKRERSVPSIIIAPTAAGKSLFVAKIAEGIEGNVVVLQPSKELLEQNLEKFRMFGGRGAVYSASFDSRKIGSVTFATIGSIKNLGRVFKDKGFKYMLIDECFPYDTIISTKDGCSKIGFLYKLQRAGKELPLVKSYNQSENKFEFKKIVRVKYNGVKKCAMYHFSSNRVIKCTPNHEFLTINGYKAASDLVYGDAIISSTQERVGKKDFPYLNSNQLDVAFGSILGDGSFDKRKEIGAHCGRVRIIHGAKQKDYLYWKASVFNSKVKYHASNGYAQTEAYTTNTPTFYFNEKKKTLEYIISKLNWRSLAILWMDDGHLAKAENAGTLCAKSSSLKYCKMIYDKLISLDIPGISFCESKSSSTKRPYWYIRFTKQGVDFFSKKIAKYVHPSMSYKITKKYKRRCGTYVWNYNYLYNVSVFLYSKGVKNLQKYVPCYDLEVEDFHNYVVCSDKNRKPKFKNNSADGQVVHNCDRFPRESSSMLGKFLSESGITHVLGLTATPLKLQQNYDVYGNTYSKLVMLTNRSGKGNFFKDIIHVTQIQEMTRLGYWSRLEYELYEVNMSGLVYNSTKAEYTEESILKMYEMNSTSERIKHKISELVDRRSILVFVPSVAAAKKLASEVPSAAAVYGDMPKDERDYVIKKFKEGKIRVVFNFGVLTVGFDYPQLDCIILGRVSSSLTLYYQIIGRLTRIHPDKKDGLVVDFSGMVQRFGKVDKFYYVQERGKWKLYGEGGVLLSGIPIHEIGKHTHETENKEKKVFMTFGQYKGMEVKLVPKSYRDWAYLNVTWNQYNEHIKEELDRIKKIESINK